MRKGFFAALFALVSVGANLGPMSDLFSLDHPAEAPVVIAAAPEQTTIPGASAPAAQNTEAPVAAPAAKVSKRTVAEKASTAVKFPKFDVVAFRGTNFDSARFQAALSREMSNLDRAKAVEANVRYREAMKQVRARMEEINRNRPVKVMIHAVPPAPPATPVAQVYNSGELLSPMEFSTVVKSSNMR